MTPLIDKLISENDKEEDKYFVINLQEFFTEKVDGLENLEIMKTFVVNENLIDSSIKEFLVYLELAELDCLDREVFYKVLEKINKDGYILTILLFVITELLKLKDFIIKDTLNTICINSINIDNNRIKKSIKFYSSILEILKGKIKNYKNKYYFFNNLNKEIIDNYANEDFEIKIVIENFLKEKFKNRIENLEENLKGKKIKK